MNKTATNTGIKDFTARRGHFLALFTSPFLSSKIYFKVNTSQESEILHQSTNEDLTLVYPNVSVFFIHTHSRVRRPLPQLYLALTLLSWNTLVGYDLSVGYLMLAMTVT